MNPYHMIYVMDNNNDTSLTHFVVNMLCAFRAKVRQSALKCDRGEITSDDLEAAVSRACDEADFLIETFRIWYNKNI